jgi:hypothetical protein
MGAMLRLVATSAAASHVAVVLWCHHRRVACYKEEAAAL